MRHRCMSNFVVKMLCCESTIGHACSTINGQPLLVNHLILIRFKHLLFFILGLKFFAYRFSSRFGSPKTVLENCFWKTGLGNCLWEIVFGKPFFPYLSKYSEGLCRKPKLCSPLPVKKTTVPVTLLVKKKAVVTCHWLPGPIGPLCYLALDKRWQSCL